MPAAANTAFQALREAIVTMLAALATMFCALAVDAEPGHSVHRAVRVAIAQPARSRSTRTTGSRGTLPAVSPAALGVGMLLLHAPWLGAAFFIIAISVSIWLRRFGPLVRRAGSPIALPFVVILTTPYVPTTRVSATMALLLPIIVALLALFWVTLFHVIARRLRWLPPGSLRQGSRLTAAARQFTAPDGQHANGHPDGCRSGRRVRGGLRFFSQSDGRGSC